MSKKLINSIILKKGIIYFENKLGILTFKLIYIWLETNEKNRKFNHQNCKNFKCYKKRFSKKMISRNLKNGIIKTFGNNKQELDHIMGKKLKK